MPSQHNDESDQHGGDGASNSDAISGCQVTGSPEGKNHYRQTKRQVG